MGRIELEQFSLVAGVTREEFVRRDAEAQTWAYLHRAGLRRRTTAIGADGEVLVVTLLAADAAEAPGAGPADALAGVVDRATYRRRAYDDLD